MKIPIYLKLKLIKKTIDSPLVILKNFSNGYFKVKTKNGLIFKARGKTTDLAEIIVVSSGFEYPFDIIKLPNNPIILDIGAHIGTFSINICNKFININPKIYSYEPFEQNYSLLKENIRINGFEKNIEFFRKAIGIENKIVYLENIENPDSIIVTNRKTSYEIEQISFDQMFDDLHINKIDLLKMDIEGGEVDIINKYHKELSKCDSVLLEFHGDKTTSNKLEKQLYSIGFKLIHRKNVGSHIIYLKNKNISENCTETTNSNTTNHLKLISLLSVVYQIVLSSYFHNFINSSLQRSVL